MHEALYRFRHDDPNRDGKEDTYGWSPDVSHWSLAFSEVFAAYDNLPFDLMKEHGTIVWVGIQPEAKQALRELHKWYTEGLLDPDFPLDTQGIIGNSKFTDGKIGCLFPVDGYNNYRLDLPGSLANKMRDFDPKAEIVPAPPLRDSAGRRRGRAWGGAAHVMQLGKQLERQPEKVLRFLDMMETIASNKKLYMETRNGERGVNWDYTPQDGVHLLPPFDSTDRARLNTLQLVQLGCLFYFPCSLDPVYDDKFLSVAERNWLHKNQRPAWGMMNVLGKTDVVPSSGKYLANLVNFQMKVFVGMVVGNRSVDTFDDFVAEWRRRGGDTILKDANHMYVEEGKLYKTVGAEGNAQ